MVKCVVTVHDIVVQVWRMQRGELAVGAKFFDANSILTTPSNNAQQGSLACNKLWQFQPCKKLHYRLLCMWLSGDHTMQWSGALVR